MKDVTVGGNGILSSRNTF